jgi:HlyD family secretion protein
VSEKQGNGIVSAAAVLLLAVFAGSLLFSCAKGEKQAAARRHTVDLVTIRDVITQTGEVEPVVKVDIKSEASGRIEKVYIKEGARVSRGDTILTIDPSRLLFKKKTMSLGVKRARLERDKARRDLNDARSLATTGTVSARRLFDLENGYEVADIAYRQQLLELQDITDQLARTVITAPMNGVVTSLEVDEGEIAVSATSGFQSGTAIATVADISTLEIISQINEVDYVHLEVGQEVVIRPQAFEDLESTGTISFISLSAKKENAEALGTFEVRIDVDSIIPGISPGINVNVDFLILEKSDVLGVPNHFVRKTPKGSFVMVAVPGTDGEETLVRRSIELGDTDYRHYEVLSGLEKGDVVVFKPDPEGPGKRKGRRGK